VILLLILLPSQFGELSRWGTPLYAMAPSLLGICLIGLFSFGEIVEFVNMMYLLGVLLEYAAFLQLRWAQPDLPRPWRVPVNIVGCGLVMLPSAVLNVSIIVISAWTTKGESLARCCCSCCGSCRCTCCCSGRCACCCFC